MGKLVSYVDRSAVGCGARRASNYSRRGLIVLFASFCASSACQSVRHGEGSEACSNPFSLAASLAPPRLPVPTPATTGRVTVIGVVIDSASGRGIRGAFVNFVGEGGNSHDTVFGRADIAGAFTVAILPGPYAVSAGSANFRLFQSPFQGRSPIDTLRILLRRSLPICRVHLD